MRVQPEMLPLAVQVEYDRVLVELQKEQPHPGDGYRLATVVQAGTGRQRLDGSIQPLSVTVGDEVLIKPVIGIGVQLRGKHFLMIREHEILLGSEGSPSRIASFLSPLS